MTDFNYSTVSIREKDTLIKQLKVDFFITPKDYQIGDVVEIEGRPAAFSIFDPSDETFINVCIDSKEKVFKIFSWNETKFSVVYDKEGNLMCLG